MHVSVCQVLQTIVDDVIIIFAFIENDEMTKVQIVISASIS